MISKLDLDSTTLNRIKKLTDSQGKYIFLTYSLDLNTAESIDLLAGEGGLIEIDHYVLNVILSHYASAIPKPKTGKLIKFRDLPGGPAYELAFLSRTIQPIADAFGKKPTDLVEASKVLGGKPLRFGDASSEVLVLEGIPVVFIVWASTEEFEGSSQVLFDESASSYLPTENLAVLAELVANRLTKAQKTRLPTKA